MIFLECSQSTNFTPSLPLHPCSDVVRAGMAAADSIERSGEDIWAVRESPNRRITESTENVGRVMTCAGMISLVVIIGEVEAD